MDGGTWAPPGWHADPSDPTGLRWWDGARWTEHTAPRPASGPAWPGGAGDGGGAPPWGGGPAWPGGGVAGSPPWGAGPGYPGLSGSPAAGKTGVWHTNAASVRALLVAAIYVVIALAFHIVFLGIVPIVLCVRAFSRRERMAPVALVAALAVVAVAVVGLR